MIAFKFEKKLIIDRCGVLGGDGTSCLDCSGTACGDKTIDQCGVCGGDGTSCLDCKGIANGQSKVDQCGICDGDGTSCLDCAGNPFGIKKLDQCGVCDGDGSSCLDCKGKIDGNAIIDRCGVCDGDGLSCLGCEEININEELHMLDGVGANLKQISYGMIKEIFNSNLSKKKKRKIAKRIKTNSQNLANQVWTMAWSIPSLYLQCSSKEFCITLEDKSSISNYKNNLDIFVNYLLKEVKIIKRNYKKYRLKKLKKSITSEVIKTNKVIESLPISQSVCIDL